MEGLHTTATTPGLNTYTPVSTSRGHGGNGNSNTHEETYLEKRKKQFDKSILEEQIKYMKAEQDFEMYITTRRRLEDEFYKDVSTNEQVSLEERLQMEKEWLYIKAQRQAESNEATLEQEEDFYEFLQRNAKQQYVDGATSFEVYQETLNRLELEHLKREQDIY